MGPVLLAIILTLIALGFIYVFGGKSRGRNYPRGPAAIPIFGNLLSMGRNPHLKMAEWAKEFGPIMAVEFGSYPAVVITDAKVIKSAFNDPDFQGRPGFQTVKDRSNGETKGLIFTEGKEWEEQRQLFQKSIRNFGLGGKSIEGIIQNEIQHLITEFRKDLRKRICTKTRFDAAAVNVLWTLITGERFEQDDPEFELALQHLCTSIEGSNFRESMSLFIPALTKISPKFFGYKKLMEDYLPTLEFIQKPIRYHQSTFQDDNTRDFIDQYLQEVHKTTDSGSSFFKERGDKSLPFAILDIFAAGAEIVSTTLSWTFLYLAKYPKVQKKLQDEIDQVIGVNRTPCLADRPKMNFAEAVIHEVLRLSSVTPFGVAHRTTKDVVLEKFTIPKDTMILANIYGVHHDEEIWGDTDNFRPQRFLNRKGEFKKNPNFIAFSAGKRSCIGESLARDEIFLFMTSLLKIFTIKPPAGSEDDDLKLEPRMDAILTPLPHKLVLREPLL